MWRSTYLFYDIMNYPVPFQKELFSYEEVVNTLKAPESLDFSRAKPCPLMQEYVDEIDTYGRLWKSLPFVEAIYLANSITFNALHDTSDIDLCIITSEGRMWSARVWSALLLFMIGIKRWKTRVRKKFCLSFYISDNHIDIQSMRLLPSDPYLIYRLAHLVPLYHRLPEHPIDIYEHNYRLRDYLPLFPMEHTIHLWTQLYGWTSLFKNGIEKICGGRLWDVFEWCIKWCWVPILLWKKKRLGPAWDAVIISDVMLKFHHDKRKEYAMKWKVSLAAN